MLFHKYLDHHARDGRYGDESIGLIQHNLIFFFHNFFKAFKPWIKFSLKTKLCRGSYIRHIIIPNQNIFLYLYLKNFYKLLPKIFLVFLSNSQYLLK